MFVTTWISNHTTKKMKIYVKKRSKLWRRNFLMIQYKKVTERNTHPSSIILPIRKTMRMVMRQTMNKWWVASTPPGWLPTALEWVNHWRILGYWKNTYQTKEFFHCLIQNVISASRRTVMVVSRCPELTLPELRCSQRWGTASRRTPWRMAANSIEYLT